MEAIVNLTSTGLVFGDITVAWCKKISDDTDVSQTGMTLVERGNGFYKLANPNITEDSDFYVYETATPANFAIGIFGIADGDIARDSTVAKEATLTTITDIIGGISNIGSAVSRPASSYVLTTGTQTANTYAETEELDGVRHTHTDSAGSIDLYYEFVAPTATPASVTVTGYLTGANDSVGVYGYDWISTSWKQIGTLDGKNSPGNEVNSYNLFVNMIGRGTDEGKVRIRFYEAAGLTSATLAIDQIYMSFSRGLEGYSNGQLWFDSNASNTDSIPGIDGTSGNPVSSLSALRSLVASTNLRRIYVAPYSSIVLDSDFENYTFEGPHWTVDLNGYSISGTHFKGAEISGVCTGTSEPHFEYCHIQDVSIPAVHMSECEIDGTLTLTEDSGVYMFDRCFSGVAAPNTPTISYGTGTQDVQIRSYFGGIKLENMIAGQLFTMEGYGQFKEGTCSGGTVTLRGSFNTSGITNITLATLANAPSLFDDIKGTGFDTNQHSLKDIKNTMG